MLYMEVLDIMRDPKRLYEVNGAYSQKYKKIFATKRKNKFDAFLNF
jgi:hypothetical protein